MVFYIDLLINTTLETASKAHSATLMSLNPRNAIFFIGDININLQPKDQEIFRHQPANTINKEIPNLTRSYLELRFTHSLEQMITRPTDQTATLIDHILTNSPDKVSQSGIIDLGLSDHYLIYCTRKTSLPKSHEHEIFVR